MTLPELAERQLADYDLRHPDTLFSQNGQPALTLEEAYRLQFMVARLRERRGEAVAGYKVGCISPVMQAQLAIDRPVFGHIFASELHRSGAILDPQQYDGLAIEGEFGIRLARDIPGAAWLHGHRDEVLASGFAVIELHNYALRNSPHTAQELIGNNAIHAGVVLPLQAPGPPAQAHNRPPIGSPAAAGESAVRGASEESSGSRFEELLDEPISVFRNHERLGTATARALPEGPFGSLMRLAQHLEGYGCCLRRGQLILTGSPLGLYRVADGDTIQVVCDRLGGRVSATIAGSDGRLAHRHKKRLRRGGVVSQRDGVVQPDPGGPEIEQ